MDNLKNNCPCGHGEMQEGTVMDEIVFRGVTVNYQLECLVCPVCDMTRSTVDQAANAQTAIADAYRKKVGLLTGEEIKQYRKVHTLSQQQLAEKAHCAKMSIVRWENGVIQKSASDKALRDILCPVDPHDEFTGNRALSLVRIKLVYEEFQKHVSYELLIPNDKGLYAAKNCWYADLVAYREIGCGMTGASYAIMPFGPQLDNYADLVDEILKTDTSKVKPLSSEEMAIIKKLSVLFNRQKDAFDASHAEPEWKRIDTNLGQRISYKIAFKLKAI